MGDIELVQVLREGFENEDAKAIEDTFEKFDARDCQCFHVEEKQRMLTIIEAAFGSVDAFNTNVQQITRQVRMKLSIRPCMLRAPFATEESLLLLGEASRSNSSSSSASSSCTGSGS